MKIPKRVKIGWKVYQVKKDVAGQSLVMGGDLLYGDINYSTQEIHLNKDFSKAQQKATLVHEIVHGISDMYGLGFEEETVEVFSNALYATMQDNPGLFS